MSRLEMNLKTTTMALMNKSAEADRLEKELENRGNSVGVSQVEQNLRD